MKKLLTMVLVLCLGASFTNVFGQQTDGGKNEKKGGFTVGGYNNAKQMEVKKRSIEINEQAEKTEKSEDAAVPPPPPPPAQAPLPDSVPAPEKGKKVMDKDSQGNTYSKDKGGLEEKDFSQARLQSAKEKQKAKKNSKSKRGK